MLKYLSSAITLFLGTEAFSQSEKILTNHPAEDRYASYSPNGETILFESNRNGNWDIFIMNQDGTGQRALTANPSQDRRPSWHPSGKKILFESVKNGKNQLYEFEIKSRKIKMLEIRDFSGEPTFARYSPNGKQIAFSANYPGENPNIFIIGNKGRNLISFTNTNFRTVYPDWSPDGKSLAFFSRHETKNEDDEIYITNVDGSNEQRLTNWPKHNFCPRWSPDGKKLAYAISMENSRPEIYIMDLDSRNETRVTNNSDGDTLPSWSLDGRKLLITGFRNGNYEICEVSLAK